MVAPTQPANVKIALANSERSTHGTSATSSDVPSESAMRAKADISARLVLASIGYGWRAAVLPVPDHPAMLATKAYVHIADFANAKAYLEERDPSTVASVELGGIRTLVVVPIAAMNLARLCRQAHAATACPGLRLVYGRFSRHLKTPIQKSLTWWCHEDPLYT
jgi:hypothetical protein